jgi:toxin YhaV
MKDTEWTVYLSNEVASVYRKLIVDVEKLSCNNPADYADHPNVKHLRKLQKAIRDVVANPFGTEFLLGKTLGDKHKGWRRVKRDLPSRYRLFFRFFETTKEIFFVWLNDAKHIRREGHSSDVYKAFGKKLERDEIPKDRDSLVEQSTKFSMVELDLEKDD